MAGIVADITVSIDGFVTGRNPLWSADSVAAARRCTTGPLRLTAPMSSGR
jgi:hypothetical protein